MPPIVIWALGALGIAAAARFLAREHRRINDELARTRAGEMPKPAPGYAKLKREPGTGIYRPQDAQ